MKDKIVASCLAVAYATLAYGRTEKLPANLVLPAGGVVLDDTAEVLTFVHPSSMAVLTIDRNGNLIVPGGDPADPSKFVARSPVLQALEVNGEYKLITGDTRCDDSLERAQREDPPHSFVICLRDDRLRRFATGVSEGGATNFLDTPPKK